MTGLRSLVLYGNTKSIHDFWTLLWILTYLKQQTETLCRTKWYDIRVVGGNVLGDRGLYLALEVYIYK